ncbi:MAG: BamA/TamA family outer membrane protein, partial [Flavobacteriaceae bacterium]|nr:BamA/TamA family outer membrane protein [Flavobacteriaceae bacterium]
MNPNFTKISLILGLIVFFASCNAVKRVPDDQFLLTENTVIVDSSEVTDFAVTSQLYQRPNPKFPLLGIPVGLHIYNLADPNPDSTFQAWLNRKPKRKERLINFLSKKQVDALDSSYVSFNKWLQRTGSAPVLINEQRAEKSEKRLHRYFHSFGYFNNEVRYEIDVDSQKPKRAEATYYVDRKQPYFLDSISANISSPAVDSLFQNIKDQTLLTPGEQYSAVEFSNERARLTTSFRNSGLYYFDQDYITINADTVNTNHKVNFTYVIPDRTVKDGDSTYTKPFEVHTVNKVRIVTDYTFENRNKQFSDSASYKGYQLYSYDELTLKPKAIADAIGIRPGKIFKAVERTQTYNQISDLKIFKYPSISYQKDPADSTGLIATILLTPQKLFNLGFDFATYTSSIQTLGIGFSGNMLFRNVFRGAEILDISGRGSIGSSVDAADSESSFFNVSELGADVKLSFPRILFPLNTDEIIPKSMSPSTIVSVGVSAQNNIGLDRNTANTMLSYRWKPRRTRTNLFDLVNVQYIRNLNTDNFYNVYRNSYQQVNGIAREVEDNDPGVIDPNFYTLNDDGNLNLIVPSGVDNFLSTFSSGIYNLDRSEEQRLRGIREREQRLTQDNLIFTSGFTWTRDTRDNIFDLNFSRTRFKVETAGNLLSGIASLAGLKQNAQGQYETFGVAFSQYAKFEADYIKHWVLSRNSVIAVRAFGGIAIPYGNSSSIPFIRSYFAGGANDNRGWTAYDLGPGSSG